MKGVKFIKPPRSNGVNDWRDLAVRDLLVHSNSDYVLFLEQDFLFKNETIFEFLPKYTRPFLGYKQGERIHPAFALVARSVVEKTSKDFSARPDHGYDHFGLFFMEVLKQIDEPRFIDNYNFENQKHFYHLNALTQNFHVFQAGEQFFKLDEFLTYIDGCLTLKVPQSDKFQALCEKIINRYGKGNIKFIRDFFPKENGISL